MPLPYPENMLVMDVYDVAGNARNYYGDLVYPVLFKVMELLGLDESQQLDVLEKAVIIEGIVQQKQAEKLKKERENVESHRS